MRPAHPTMGILKAPGIPVVHPTRRILETLGFWVTSSAAGGGGILAPATAWLDLFHPGLACLEYTIMDSLHVVLQMCYLHSNIIAFVAKEHFLSMFGLLVLRQIRGEREGAVAHVTMMSYAVVLGLDVSLQVTCPCCGVHALVTVEPRLLALVLGRRVNPQPVSAEADKGWRDKLTLFTGIGDTKVLGLSVPFEYGCRSCLIVAQVARVPNPLVLELNVLLERAGFCRRVLAVVARVPDSHVLDILVSL